MNSTPILLTLFLALVPQTAPRSPPEAVQAPNPVVEELWDAAREGAAARVTAALDMGVDVNAQSRYGATALTFAADKGHAHIVQLLLDRAADPNARDTFYKMRALDNALDRSSGRIVWEQTAFTGLPEVKRHTTASQPNSTPSPTAPASSRSSARRHPGGGLITIRTLGHMYGIGVK